MSRPVNATTRSGYILLESLVALAVLSVGVYTVHAAFQQAALARGQAADYTAARFLLQQSMGELEALPMLELGTRDGRYDAPQNRFRWRATVSKVPLHVPEGLRPAKAEPFHYPRGRDFLLRLSVTVEWERAGHAHREALETLLGPERLREHDDEA